MKLITMNKSPTLWTQKFDFCCIQLLNTVVASQVCVYDDRRSSLALTTLHVMWTAIAVQLTKHQNARRKRRNRRRPVHRGRRQMKMPRKSVTETVLHLFFRGHRFSVNSKLRCFNKWYTFVVLCFVVLLDESYFIYLFIFEVICILQ